MPDIRCSDCGQIVRVRGLAATCPHCGNLLIAAKLPPPKNAASSPSPTTPQTGTGSNDVRQTPPSPGNIAGADVNLDEPVDLSFLAEKLEAADYRTPLLHENAPRAVVPVIPEIEEEPADESGRNYQAWVALAAAVGICGLLVLIILAFRHSSNSTTATPLSTPVAVAPPTPSISQPSTLVEQLPTTTLTLTPEKALIPATVPAVEPPYPFASLANVVPLQPSQKRASKLTDAEIGEAIRRGVDYLLNQFSGSRLRGGDQTDPETFAGRNALCAYALLHAGQTLADPRITAQAEGMRDILTRLKEFAMEGQRATYSRSLRLGALTVYNRPDDRAAINIDADWLIKSSTHGRFTYSMIDDNARATGNFGWDNSNSQYGALGLWFAADSGTRVPNIFWADVEQHWIETQVPTGGWSYNSGGSATLSMTAAGITSMLVARDQLIANSSESRPNAEAPRAIRRALEWLDEGDNVLAIDNGHPGYVLYSLERAGLASGYRFFGTHDWYLELAARRLKEQQADGSWTGGDGAQVETAFTLLFLSRGRHPVLLSKLRFDGNWQNSPRDLEYLTRFASKQLERPLNWQIVDIDRPWQEWSDSGVVYLATDRPPQLKQSQIESLRSYIEAGGLLFTQADNASAATNEFAKDLAKQLFPDYPLADIPSTHPLFSSVYPQKNPPHLLGVSNGVRLLMIHSPTDLGKLWARRNEKLNREAFETGLNIAVYAGGRRELRNRLETLSVSAPIDSPIARVPVARVKFAGNWDPEPGAWRRASLVIENETRFRLDVKIVAAKDLSINTAPLAVITVADSIQLDAADLKSLNSYVSSGGVLLADAMSGEKSTVESISTALLAKLSVNASNLPSSSPILRGDEHGLAKIDALRLRPYATQMLGTTTAPPLRVARLGQGTILLSDINLTSGLLGTAVWGIVGYQPTTSETLVKNIILWAMHSPPR